MSVRLTMTAEAFNGNGAVTIKLDSIDPEEMQTVLHLMEAKPLVIEHVGGNEFFLHVEEAQHE